MDYSDKKVMFITGSLTDGGAEKVIAMLASGCAELGAYVSLVVLREKEATYSVNDKVVLYQISSKKGRFQSLKRIRELHNIIKNDKATYIIPFLPIITIYTVLANIGIGKKIIMSERNDPSKKNIRKGISIKDQIGNVIFRKFGLCRLAERMVFQTDDAMKWYGKRFQKKGVVIPNPLDTEHLPLRFEGDRDKTIVSVGRLTRQKNFALLIGAFAEFDKVIPGYRLKIYGNGPLKDELTGLCAELGITGKVDMEGFVANLPEMIRTASVFVLSSDFEGISNAMLEALGMGIPSILTDCPIGGARMFVKNGENGVLIPTGDREALTKALIKVTTDSAFAEQISKNAVQIRENIGVVNICKRWLELV